MIFLGPVIVKYVEKNLGAMKHCYTLSQQNFAGPLGLCYI